MRRPPPPVRARFRWFYAIGTRWADNDIYGHVNNTIYYAWIDTAVNRHLLDQGLLDPAKSQVVGIVAETGCRYISQITYPDDVAVGLVVTQLGRSSVRYEVGVFRGEEDAAAAAGHFVHVYVDRVGMRPVAIPDVVRRALERIAAPG